ncbi:MAG: 16S rRNA (uracil(1498)-N(3))-methyltransferase [Muribaculaceae bacterium]|nr:16S rRNA (uracil(1498)-N(3))-methyltransferase [Muribaculaceae bacterium]MCM1481020.1 16S rRNA (uracil(1498)-N(3))-methyltransferase [Muribaculaceae bacterium]
MPRFFTPAPPGDFITVTGSDARHIGYSLRMKIGDGLTFCHGGIDYACIIEKITETEVLCRVESSAPTLAEPSVSLTVYQAYPKQDKLELIVQKTAELGACRIVPFLSARCVARPDRKSYEKKQVRLQKIAEEAAKQSGRGRIPEIAPLMTFPEVLEDIGQCGTALFCYENGGKRLRDVSLPENGSVGVIIGSEGGFDRSEAELAQAAGAVPIWLGERILRCETCPIAVTAIIMNLTNNM